MGSGARITRTPGLRVAGYRGRVKRLLATSAAALVSLGAGAAGGAPGDQVQATFVGDSVSASIVYVPSAQSRLERGMAVALDLKVCRRLVQPSCSFNGSTPTTALQAVRGYGRRLGDVLVVDVGYNEGAAGYGKGVDQVMRAALQQGAKGVVWVTLRETIPSYHATNVAIAQGAKRWPELHVADWNSHSAGKPWFIGDGLHLTSARREGARELRPLPRRRGGARERVSHVENAASSSARMSDQMLLEPSRTPITERPPRCWATTRHPPARVVQPVFTP